MKLSFFTHLDYDDDICFVFDRVIIFEHIVLDLGKKAKKFELKIDTTKVNFLSLTGYPSLPTLMDITSKMSTDVLIMLNASELSIHVGVPSAGYPRLRQ